ALGGRLVGAPAQEGRGMAKAVALKVIVFHLAYTLDAQRLPRQVLARAPAALAAGHALRPALGRLGPFAPRMSFECALAKRLELPGELPARGHGERRGYADVVQHALVGVTSSFTMATRRQLARELEPLRKSAFEGHPWREWAEAAEGGTQRMPGGQSRWSAGKDLSWEPLRIERVCEVKYDHLQGDRFRHAATFLRWRPDKPPAEC